MDNAPIFTTNNAPEGTSFKTPRKSPNPKVRGLGLPGIRAAWPGQTAARGVRARLYRDFIPGFPLSFHTSFRPLRRAPARSCARRRPRQP